jgi:lipoate---protein ligase
MSVIIRPYDLDDAVLFSGKGNGMMVWQPKGTIIVLGQSNTPVWSLVNENVGTDSIPVTRRPTGGEAVVLTPRMAVITVAREFREMTSSKDFFRVINGIMLDALSDLGVKNYGTKGISDITSGDRKILGSSMHRRENRLVYHGVLNISEDPGIFERYLRHPRREPDYRQSRKHSDFVTSLKNEGYNIGYKDIEAILNSYKDFIVPLNNYSTAYDRQ